MTIEEAGRATFTIRCGKCGQSFTASLADATPPDGGPPVFVAACGCADVQIGFAPAGYMPAAPVPPPPFAWDGESPLVSLMRQIRVVEAIDRASYGAMGMPYPPDAADAPHVVGEAR